MTKDERDNWVENNFVNLNEFQDSFSAIIDYITDRLDSALSEDRKYRPINKDDFRKLQINLLIEACKLQFIGSSRVYHNDDNLEILISWKDSYEDLTDGDRPGAMFKDLLLVIDKLQGELPEVAKEFTKD